MKSLILTLAFFSPILASAHLAKPYCKYGFHTAKVKTECFNVTGHGYFQASAVSVCRSKIKSEKENEKSRLSCFKVIKNKTYNQRAIDFVSKLDQEPHELIKFLSENGKLNSDLQSFKCSQKYENYLLGWENHDDDNYYGDSSVSSFSGPNLDNHLKAQKILKIAQSGEESIELYDLMEEVNEESITEVSLDQTRELLKELDQKGLFCQEGEEPADYDGVVSTMVKILKIREE